MGVILEGTSASVVFEIMAADNPSFAGLNYARLAEVEPQWPIVGRGDMYYGGTTYANKQGLGVQLIECSTARREGKPAAHPKDRRPAAEGEEAAGGAGHEAVRPRRHRFHLRLLDQRIGEPFVALHPSTAEKFGVMHGQHVTLSLDGASEEVVVKMDDTISTGVALGAAFDGTADQRTGRGEPQSSTKKGRGEVAMDWTFWLEWLIKAVVMVLVLLTGFAYLTLYERRALARIQSAHRPEPRRPAGLAAAHRRRGQVDLQGRVDTGRMPTN